MKKACSVFLAFLLLVTASPTNRFVHAVAALGISIHHFVHHIAEHVGAAEVGALSLAHFIQYEHHGGDHHAHDPLPFDCCHHHTHVPTGSQLSYMVDTHLRLPESPSPESHGGSLFNYSEHWRPSTYAGKIWQPPKA